MSTSSSNICSLIIKLCLSTRSGASLIVIELHHSVLSGAEYLGCYELDLHCECNTTLCAVVSVHRTQSQQSQ